MMRTPEEQEALFDRMEAFLNDYAKADNEFQTNQRKSNWNNKFGERFAPYAEKLKKLNGDDFDIMNASFDEYEKDYSDLSDDEYCDALENNIKATLQRIWPDEPEKVEQAVEEVKETVAEEPAGEEPAKEEIHIESEDKDGDGKISKDETEVHAMEEKPATETEQETDESEEDKFVKDLEDYKAKMPKRG